MLRREAEQAGKLVHLPPPGEQRTTPTLTSITSAPAAPPVDPARLADVIQRTEPAPAATVKSKVAAADMVLEAHRRGEQVDAEALRRARLCAGTSEYRAHKMVTLDFRPSQPGAKRQQGAA
jgi:phosphate-selective porin